MRSHTRGFTLIELLVVVAMIGILAGVLALNVTSSRASMNLDIGASSLKSALSLAQTMGRGGQIHLITTNPTDDPTADSGRFDRGFGVYLANGSNAVIIYGGGAGNSKLTRADNVYSTSTFDNTFDVQHMPGTVTVKDLCINQDNTSTCSNSRDQINIHFRRGEREAIIYGNETTDTTPFNSVRVTLTAGGTETRTILVYRTGLFYIND